MLDQLCQLGYAAVRYLGLQLNTTPTPQGILPPFPPNIYTDFFRSTRDTINNLPSGLILFGAVVLFLATYVDRRHRS